MTESEYIFVRTVRLYPEHVATRRYDSLYVILPSGQVVEVKRSVFARCRDAGWCTYTAGAQRNGRRRGYFRVTDEGTHALEAYEARSHTQPLVREMKRE